MAYCTTCKYTHPGPECKPGALCYDCAGSGIVHAHCDRCGCTWDPECEYGGWHTDDEMSMPGHPAGNHGSTCAWTP